MADTEGLKIPIAKKLVALVHPNLLKTLGSQFGIGAAVEMLNQWEGVETEAKICSIQEDLTALKKLHDAEISVPAEPPPVDCFRTAGAIGLVARLVLGILSLSCFGLFTGVERDEEKWELFKDCRTTQSRSPRWHYCFSRRQLSEGTMKRRKSEIGRGTFLSTNGEAVILKFRVK